MGGMNVVVIGHLDFQSVSCWRSSSKHPLFSKQHEVEVWQGWLILEIPKPKQTSSSLHLGQMCFVSSFLSLLVGGDDTQKVSISF